MMKRKVLRVDSIISLDIVSEDDLQLRKEPTVRFQAAEDYDKE